MRKKKNQKKKERKKKIKSFTLYSYKWYNICFPYFIHSRDYKLVHFLLSSWCIKAIYRPGLGSFNANERVPPHLWWYSGFSGYSCFSTFLFLPFSSLFPFSRFRVFSPAKRLAFIKMVLIPVACFHIKQGKLSWKFNVIKVFIFFIFIFYYFPCNAEIYIFFFVFAVQKTASAVFFKGWILRVYVSKRGRKHVDVAI